MILFAGGDCAEDNQTNLKEELQGVTNTKICSPDTLLRVQKSLSLSKDIYLSKNDIKNEFSENEKLNALNLSILTHTQQLNQFGYPLQIGSSPLSLVFLHFFCHQKFFLQKP